MRQLLAGMIAEPAFLSEYTIFALDSSKQPKTQTESVVSPSTAFCIPCVGKQSNLVILEAYLMLLVTDHLSKHFQPLLLNDSNGGSDWSEHNVDAGTVYARQSKTKEGSERLFEITDMILKANISKGSLKK